MFLPGTYVMRAHSDKLDYTTTNNMNQPLRASVLHYQSYKLKHRLYWLSTAIENGCLASEGSILNTKLVTLSKK